jgi:hypothetical protein
MVRLRMPHDAKRWSSSKWGSAIQIFVKRSLDLGGSTKSKNKDGRSGKGSSIVCNAALSADPRSELMMERLNDFKFHLITSG